MTRVGVLAPDDFAPLSMLGKYTRDLRNAEVLLNA